jgi:hypothetical protein
MTRYYNENPRESYLLEKIEEQEKMIKELQSENNILYYKFSKISSKAERILLQRDSFHRQIVEFNHYPWWRKIFYKFKI